MRCAITGALSYTGRYLAARLLAKGHDVLNLSRRATPIALAPLSQRQADALARALCRRLRLHHDYTALAH